MVNAHRRKKQPDIVRRALLEHGSRLAMERGMTAVTVQAVAKAAGVTKGGFTHHFPSKQSFINAIFQDLLEELGEAIRGRMRADPIPHGSFTRAYMDAVFDEEPKGKTELWAALAALIVSEPSLREIWVDTLASWQEQAKGTDATPELTMVRLAADGVSLADFTGSALPDRAMLREQMRKVTYMTND